MKNKIINNRGRENQNNIIKDYNNNFNNRINAFHQVDDFIKTNTDYNSCLIF